MRLLIIRHGDPDYSIDSLTEKGWREANLLSDRLVKENITKVYCSPLGRAQDTARPTLERLGMDFEVLDWLHEFTSGVKTDYAPDGAVAWNMPPAYWSHREGIYDRDGWREVPLFKESNVPHHYDQVGRELQAFLEQNGYRRVGDGADYEILPGFEDDDRTIAFFCHLGLGNVLLSHLTGVSLPVWWHNVFLPPSSVTTVYTEKHDPASGKTIMRLVGIGDTSHLFAGGEPISWSGLHSPIR